MEKCADVCKGYRFFGLEYSSEYVTLAHLRKFLFSSQRGCRMDVVADVGVGTW